MPIRKSAVVLTHSIPNAQNISIKHLSEFFNLLLIHPLSAVLEASG